MKKTCKLLALVLALVMLLGILAACGGKDTETDKGSAPSGDSTAPSGDSSSGSDAEAEKDYTLRIGILNANMTHDPNAAGGGNRTQRRLLFEPLLEQDPVTRELKPWLAKSAEFTDDTTLRIELRDDVYFTDGQHLTARDVWHSYKDHWAVGQMGSYFACYDWDASQIIDDYTIEFKFTKPYGPAMSYLASWSIYCYDDMVFGDDPADADKWMTAPNATGPYYCVENVESAYATYARKDAENYWGELPECTEITYKFYSEPTTMYMDFENGALDAACGISATDAQRVLDGDCPAFTGYYLNSIRDNLLVILPEEIATFDDERVRKAFFMAIDREAVSIANYGCLYMPADSLLPDSVKYYESQADKLVEYDPEGARALLAEAGYPDGLSFRLVVTSDQATLAEALQASLATAGINISVESYDVATAIPMFWNMETDFMCKQAEGGAYINEPGLLVDTLSPVSTLPPAGMQDPVWAEAFEQAHYNTSDAERAAGFAKMQEWAIGTYRVLPLCTRANMTIYNTDKLASFVLKCADEPLAQYAVFN